MATGTIEAETAVERVHPTDPATLIRDHQAGVWRYVRYLGANCAEADDLVQKAFLAVLRRPFDERSHTETAAYLRTAARRRLLMLRRKQGRETRLAIPLDELPLADTAWSEATGDAGLDDYLDALRDCLESAISDRDRAAITNQYARMASRAAIAEELKITVEGVKRCCEEQKSSCENVLNAK